MKSAIASLLILLTAFAPAEDVPRIKIVKSSKLNIAITALAGGDLETLRRDLVNSGYFAVTGADQAQFTASARESGGLHGSVTDHDGKSSLSKSYGASGRPAVHRFADDIVQALTGARGIASTKLAFVGTRTGKKEIYTCDADGSNLVQLTHDGTISVSPGISPDGQSLVYTGYQSGYADVYRITLGSGARTRILKYPGTNSGAKFSPDGGKLAVTLSKDGNPEIYVTSASGGSVRRITRTPGVESSPTWSPDGGELIYSSDDSGSPQLYRVAASGGTPVRLQTGFGYNTAPSWSPDGKKIAFNTRGGGSFSVAILDLNGGPVHTVGDGEGPVWGADSRHLVFASGSSLVMLDTQTGTRTTIVSGAGKISEPTWSR
ncbi:MAG: biopolymer transporter Tol [Chthoniobacteraceae bacterium]